MPGRLVSVCVVGLSVLVVAGCSRESLPASPQSGNPAAGKAAVSSPPQSGPTIAGSAPLLKRLLELRVASLRQQQPTATEAELTKQATDQVQNEIAAGRKLFAKFLMLPPAQDQLLESGRALPNTKTRLAFLQRTTNEFALKVTTPPGLDMNKVDASAAPIDGELLAHYLELGLISLVTALQDKPELIEGERRKMDEVIRILREEDLTALNSLDAVGEQAKKNLDRAKAQDAKSP